MGVGPRTEAELPTAPQLRSLLVRVGDSLACRKVSSTPPSPPLGAFTFLNLDSCLINYSVIFFLFFYSFTVFFVRIMMMNIQKS